MSSGPRTAVNAGMCGASVAPKVGYTNGSDGTAPWCHASTFLRARSDCRGYLLVYLRARKCMPLKERLEQHGGLFLDSTSTLTFRGGYSGSEELPENSSSSATTLLSPNKMGSLPLFYLIGGAG